VGLRVGPLPRKPLLQHVAKFNKSISKTVI
jgi:hypothetical protein